jgi:hypothetical protein
MRRRFRNIVLWGGSEWGILGLGEARAGFLEPIYMVDSPTAGILGHGEYHIQGRIGPESSILMGFRVGVRNRVHLGVSFGMQNVFSYEPIDVNEKVGFQFRLRLLEEGNGPALALGFNNQGTGRYHDETERYDRKSRGFYGVLSRNWKIPVGNLSLHGGVNYSLEDRDDDDPDVFAAVDWEVVPGLELLLDLDAAFNDSADDGQFGGGGPYLDGAVRVSYGENLSMMLIFRDLTKNFEPERRIGREFEIAFVDFF